MCVCVCVCGGGWGVCLSVCLFVCLSVCLFVCLSVFVCVCMDAWMYMHVCMYVCVYVCMYVCMCVFVSVCVSVSVYMYAYSLYVHIHTPFCSTVPFLSPLCVIKTKVSHFIFPIHSMLLVDGALTEWSEWGQCTKTCGNGTQNRTRSCSNPAPSNGGKNCSGVIQEYQACNTQNCPGKCID